MVISLDMSRCELPKDDSEVEIAHERHFRCRTEVRSMSFTISLESTWPNRPRDYFELTQKFFSILYLSFLEA